MSSPKEYLGDGVYAVFDGHAIVLTTENGVCITNTIYVEPQVLEALLAWIERRRAASEAKL